MENALQQQLRHLAESLALDFSQSLASAHCCRTLKQLLPGLRYLSIALSNPADEGVIVASANCVADGRTTTLRVHDLLSSATGLAHASGRMLQASMSSTSNSTRQGSGAGMAEQAGQAGRAHEALSDVQQMRMHCPDVAHWLCLPFGGSRQSEGRGCPLHRTASGSGALLLGFGQQHSLETRHMTLLTMLAQLLPEPLERLSSEVLSFINFACGIGASGSARGLPCSCRELGSESSDGEGGSKQALEASSPGGRRSDSSDSAGSPDADTLRQRLKQAQPLHPTSQPEAYTQGSSEDGHGSHPAPAAGGGGSGGNGGNCAGTGAGDGDGDSAPGDASCSKAWPWGGGSSKSTTPFSFSPATSAGSELDFSRWHTPDSSLDGSPRLGGPGTHRFSKQLLMCLLDLGPRSAGMLRQSTLSLQFRQPQVEEEYGKWALKQHLQADRAISLMLLPVIWTLLLLFKAFSIFHNAPLWALLAIAAGLSLPLVLTWTSNRLYPAWRGFFIVCARLLAVAFVSVTAMPFYQAMLQAYQMGDSFWQWFVFWRLTCAECLFITALLFPMRMKVHLPLQAAALAIAAHKLPSMCATCYPHMEPAACLVSSSTMALSVGYVLPTLLLRCQEQQSRLYFAQKLRSAAAARL